MLNIDFKVIEHEDIEYTPWLRRTLTLHKVAPRVRVEYLINPEVLIDEKWKYHKQHIADAVEIYLTSKANELPSEPGIYLVTELWVQYR